LPAQRIANPYPAPVAQRSILVHGSRYARGFAAPDTEAVALRFRINLSRRDRLGYALAAAMLLAGGAPAHAKDPIPLPRPRPLGSNATPAIPLPPLRPSIPPTVETPEPAAPSPCVLRLTADIAIVEPLPPIIAANGCGIADPVLLKAVMSQDNVRIAVTPPATLRCTTAEAVAHWVREDVAPIAATLGAPLGGVANFDSYECRGRNRVVGATISEHGKGNAIDIRALTLANGKSYELTDIHVDKDARERLKASACARFTTVLGPASDGFHENHVHVDLAERRGGYRLCQWAVRDAVEIIPLPRERPAEAPPREP
jgi:hypothetical protein